MLKRFIESLVGKPQTLEEMLSQLEEELGPVDKEKIARDREKYLINKEKAIEEARRQKIIREEIEHRRANPSFIDQTRDPWRRK